MMRNASDIPNEEHFTKYMTSTLKTIKIMKNNGSVRNCPWQKEPEEISQLKVMCTLDEQKREIR